MPVEKFRTFREARIAQWLSSDDPRLPGRIRSWWRIAAALAPVERPRGVRRFRSIEEANAERATWVRREWKGTG